jgi:methionyl-tRNA synthetase
MSPSEKAFYLTTPIYYVNDAPHIGHAYTTTAGDVLTRWHRQRGEEVWFLTGVDEHGTKVERAAEAGGVTPQQWVDRLVSSDWLPVLETVDAANDDFIRTTSSRHIEGVQRFCTEHRARLAKLDGFFLSSAAAPHAVHWKSSVVRGKSSVPAAGSVDSTRSSTLPSST